MSRLSKIHEGMQLLPTVSRPDPTDIGAFLACLFSDEVTTVTGTIYGTYPHNAGLYPNPCEGCLFSRPRDFNELDKALRALL